MKVLIVATNRERSPFPVAIEILLALSSAHAGSQSQSNSRLATSSPHGEMKRAIPMGETFNGRHGRK